VTAAAKSSRSKRRSGFRGALPYVVAAAAGALAAYLIVVLYVFPTDPDLVTPVVPSVVGEPFEAAATKLSNAGFLATQGEARPSKAGRVGTVLEQVPAAGTRSKVGSKVVLHTVAPSK
jgi:beta-lactam-binding protein with PASTA domain